MSVVELTRDGSFFLLIRCESETEALEFIERNKTNYENQGSRLILDKD